MKFLAVAAVIIFHGTTTFGSTQEKQKLERVSRAGVCRYMAANLRPADHTVAEFLLWVPEGQTALMKLRNQADPFEVNPVVEDPYNLFQKEAPAVRNYLVALEKQLQGEVDPSGMHPALHHSILGPMLRYSNEQFKDWISEEKLRWNFSSGQTAQNYFLNLILSFRSWRWFFVQKAIIPTNRPASYSFANFSDDALIARRLAELFHALPKELIEATRQFLEFKTSSGTSTEGSFCSTTIELLSLVEMVYPGYTAKLFVPIVEAASKGWTKMGSAYAFYLARAKLSKREIALAMDDLETRFRKIKEGNYSVPVKDGKLPNRLMKEMSPEETISFYILLALKEQLKSARGNLSPRLQEYYDILPAEFEAQYKVFLGRLEEDRKAISP